MARDKKRAQEVENKRSNIDMAKHLEKLKSEMVSVFFKHKLRIFIYFHLFFVGTAENLLSTKNVFLVIVKNKEAKKIGKDFRHKPFSICYRIHS